MTGSERATALFEEGYNCAQAVLGAFSDELGLTRDQALALAGPFGGGIGRTRETCGALSGLLMIYGSLSGGADKAKKAAVYEKTRELMEAFRAQAGSTFCRELLSMQREGNVPPGYAGRPCTRYVEIAAELAEQLLKDL